ncbi:MAG: hypothetical protein EA397_16220 [Deltaproteobacteria bacterium]|nr:MAG: hypothetical protein EA397_16220 [Deltaproteobacteria bacterium]
MDTLSDPSTRPTTLTLSPTPDLSELIPTVKRGFVVSFRVIALRYAAIGLCAMALTIVGGVLHFCAALTFDLGLGGTSTILGFAAIPVDIIMVLAGVALGTLQICLYRPFFRSMIEGPAAVRERGVLKVALERYWISMAAMVIFAFGLAITTSCGFFPGVVFAFLFAAFPFLIAATDTPFEKSFSRSITLSMKNAVVVIVAILTVIFLLFTLIIVVGILNFVLAVITAAAGAMLGYPFTLNASVSLIRVLLTELVGIPIGFVSMTLWGSLVSSFEAADRGLAIVLED